MSEYIKHCVYCKSEIKMSNKNEGKWLPYNLDGSEHDCKPHTNGSINGGDTIRVKPRNILQWRKGLQDSKKQFLEIPSNIKLS